MIIPGLIVGFDALPIVRGPSRQKVSENSLDDNSDESSDSSDRSLSSTDLTRRSPRSPDPRSLKVCNMAITEKPLINGCTKICKKIVKHNYR